MSADAIDFKYVDPKAIDESPMTKMLEDLCLNSGPKMLALGAGKALLAAGACTAAVGNAAVSLKDSAVSKASEFARSTNDAPEPAKAKAPEVEEPKLGKSDVSEKDLGTFAPPAFDKSDKTVELGF